MKARAIAVSAFLFVVCAGGGYAVASDKTTNGAGIECTNRADAPYLYGGNKVREYLEYCGNGSYDFSLQRDIEWAPDWVLDSKWGSGPSAATMESECKGTGAYFSALESPTGPNITSRRVTLC